MIDKFSTLSMRTGLNNLKFYRHTVHIILKISIFKIFIFLINALKLKRILHTLLAASFQRVLVPELGEVIQNQPSSGEFHVPQSYMREALDMIFKSSFQLFVLVHFKGRGWHLITSAFPIIC